MQSFRFNGLLKLHLDAVSHAYFCSQIGANFAPMPWPDSMPRCRTTAYTKLIMEINYFHSVLLHFLSATTLRDTIQVVRENFVDAIRVQRSCTSSTVHYYYYLFSKFGRRARQKLNEGDKSNEYRRRDEKNNAGTQPPNHPSSGTTALVIQFIFEMKTIHAVISCH